MGSMTLEEIAARCGVSIDRDRPIAEFTTIGVGGPARAVLKPDSMEALSRLVTRLREAGCPMRVIGGGANLIAGPGPFEEPVILTRGIKHGPLFEGRRVRAGCGVVVKRLGRLCAARGLGGLEFAEGIPGTVGGTVFMNAGSYGGQMSDVVREVTWLDGKGTIHTSAVAPEDFSYRRSPFQSGTVIVEAVFELEPGDPAVLEEKLKDVSMRRSMAQPPGERSAGCIFKNPPGDSAGRLIDSLGLKGMSIGGAAVSDIHANFIVNKGAATAAEVIDLVDAIKKKVKQLSGVDLEEEVIIWRS